MGMKIIMVRLVLDGHEDHHGAVGLGHLFVLLAAPVHLVGLHAHIHGQQRGAHRHQGQQEQADVAPDQAALRAPEVQLGNVGQIDAQELHVHGEQSGPRRLAQGSLHLLQHGGVGDGLQHGDLGIGAGVGHAGDLGHRFDHVRGHVHQIGQGLPDDAVQHHQEDDGDEGPQAPAHGVDLLLLIELLDLQVIALPVLAVLLLQLLHFTGEQVHLDHALLALQVEGEEHQLDDQGE